MLHEYNHTLSNYYIYSYLERIKSQDSTTQTPPFAVSQGRQVICLGHSGSQHPGLTTPRSQVSSHTDFESYHAEV